MMGLSRWLGVAVLAAVALVGCLEERDAWLGEGAAPPDAVEIDAALLDGVELGPAAVVAEPMDLGLCRDLDEQELRCGGAPLDVPACAQRFACSRQLWRPEVQLAVYACLRERPCDDAEPEMSCLEAAAARLEPSAAELRFERALEEVEGRCGALVDVAPGQSDLVYEGLGFCLAETEGCDAAAACTLATLEALVVEVCGSLETI
jgi:hypothetical protein